VWFVRLLSRLVDQGAAPSLDPALRKRIRLTNALGLFAAFVMFASIPFDWVTAPPWMLVEDVVGGLLFLVTPLLNRRGWLTASRLLFQALANLIVLGNAALLGPESGAPMVFFALAAMPFALFDLAQIWAVTLGVLLSVVCFVVASSSLLESLQSVSENYAPAAYRAYSATVTMTALLYMLLQMARANARAERELRENRATAIHSAKMAALGEMSGNIAHEVNNPLTAIRLRTERLARSAAAGTLEPAKVLDSAREIEKTVTRIARIVDALRSFARDVDKDPLRPEPVSQIVKDSVELCAERFRQHAITLQVGDIADDLLVACRGVQISQILLNLLSNAHDAVEGQPNAWVRLAASAVGERDVVIAVTDSGPGIPPALHERIMEPFFTTKALGKGTGLGLSVSQGIAEAHGGRLRHDPSSRHTRFLLTLPRWRASTTTSPT
jgi:C4-dicarboxylate-specific signal transduction histidine kinase